MSTFAYGGLVEQLNNTTSAAGTTTLTNTSKQIQVLTGSTTQTYTLPDATTMVVGQKFEFYNTSTGAMTINKNGGSLLLTVAAGLSAIVKLTSAGSAAGTWVNIASAVTTSPTAPTLQKFTVTGTQAGFLFILPNGSTANATAGATYTNNGVTLTVLFTIAAGGNLLLLTSGTGTLSGTTLTKSTGTGDATITILDSKDLALYTTPTSPAPLFLKVRLVGGGGGGSTSGAGGDGVYGYPSVFGNNYGFGGQGGQTVGGSSIAGIGGLAYLVTGATGLAVQGGSGGGQANTTSTAGGDGAATPFGGAGNGSSGDAGGNGTVGAANSGAGGGAGNGDGTRRGGSGGGAGGYVDAIVTSPSATYYYAVGPGGLGGSGGASNGGNGGTGVVLVEEHYQ